MTIDELITQARTLAAKATPGPWHISNEVDVETSLDGDERYCEWLAEITAKHEDHTEYLSLMITSCGLHRFAKPNADLITFARNNLERLCDEIERLQKIDTEHSQCDVDAGMLEHYCIELPAIVAERDALRAENESLKHGIAPTIEMLNQTLAERDSEREAYKLDIVEMHKANVEITRQRSELHAENVRLELERIALLMVLEPIEGHDITMMQNKAVHLKQTDGEGWAVGELLWRALRYFAVLGAPRKEPG